MAGRDDVFAKSLGSGRAALGAGPAPRIVDFSQALAQDAAAYDVSELTDFLKEYAADVKKKKDFDDVETGYNDFYEASTERAFDFNPATDDPADYQRWSQEQIAMAASNMSPDAAMAFRQRSNNEARERWTGLLSIQDQYLTKKGFDGFQRDLNTVSRNLFDLVHAGGPDQYDEDDESLHVSDDGYITTREDAFYPQVIAALKEDVQTLYNDAERRGYLEGTKVFDIAQAVDDKINATVTSASLYRYLDDDTHTRQSLRDFNDALASQDLSAYPEFKALADALPPEVRENVLKGASEFATFQIESIGVQANIARTQLATDIVMTQDAIDLAIQRKDYTKADALNDKIVDKLTAFVERFPEGSVAELWSKHFGFNADGKIDKNKFAEQTILSIVRTINTLSETLPEEDKASIQGELNAIGGYKNLSPLEKAELYRIVQSRLSTTSRGRQIASADVAATWGSSNVQKDIDSLISRIGPDSSEAQEIVRQNQDLIAKAREGKWTPSVKEARLKEIRTRLATLYQRIKTDERQAIEDANKRSRDLAAPIAAESIQAELDRTINDHRDLIAKNPDLLAIVDRIDALAQEEKDPDNLINPRDMNRLNSIYLRSLRNAINQKQQGAAAESRQAADRFMVGQVETEIAALVSNNPSIIEHPQAKSVLAGRTEMRKTAATENWPPAKIVASLNKYKAQLKEIESATKKKTADLETARKALQGVAPQNEATNKAIDTYLGLDAKGVLGLLNELAAGQVSDDTKAKLPLLQDFMAKGHMSYLLKNFFKSSLASLNEPATGQDPMKMGAAFRGLVKSIRELTTTAGGNASEKNFVRHLDNDEKSRYYAIKSAIDNGVEDETIASRAWSIYSRAPTTKPNPDIYNAAVELVHDKMDPTSYGSLFWDTSIPEEHPLWEMSTEIAKRLSKQYPGWNADQIAQSVAEEHHRNGWRISLTGVPEGPEIRKRHLLEFKPRYARQSVERYYPQEAEAINKLLEERMPRIKELLDPKILGEMKIQGDAETNALAVAMTNRTGAGMIFAVGKGYQLAWGKNLFLQAERPAFSTQSPTRFAVKYWNGQHMVNALDETGETIYFNAGLAAKRIKDKTIEDYKVLNAGIRAAQQDAANMGRRISHPSNPAYSIRPDSDTAFGD